MWNILQTVFVSYCWPLLCITWLGFLITWLVFFFTWLVFFMHLSFTYRIRFHFCVAEFCLIFRLFSYFYMPTFFRLGFTLFTNYDLCFVFNSNVVYFAEIHIAPPYQFLITLYSTYLNFEILVIAHIYFSIFESRFGIQARICWG